MCVPLQNVPHASNIGVPESKQNRSLPAQYTRTKAEKQAFEEAAMTFDRGDRSVIVLSHPWRSAALPDPDGATFDDVTIHLERSSPKDGTTDERLLFVDYSSLPQKPRSPDEAATFGKALKSMGVLYSSPFTAVIQVKTVYDGAEEDGTPYNTRAYGDRGWTNFEGRRITCRIPQDEIRRHESAPPEAHRCERGWQPEARSGVSTAQD